MMYRVILDGNDILNFQDKRYVLLKPSLEMEINTAGSFTFSMHPSHSFYDDLGLIVPTIEVYEDEELIWFGRPMEIKTDFFKNKEVYCEGALAFFNDSVQRPHEFNSVSVHEFFRYVIDAHNAQVAESRQFTVGEITVGDKKVYRNLRYENTFAVLKRQCLNAEGGYFFVRRVDGVNYIDWLSEMPDTTNQPVEFGLNLLDITSNMDGSSIVTCVLPLGEKNEETGEVLTVESVNGGSDVIESEAVATFGRITKAVSFNGVYYPDTLYDDGLEYLASKQFDDMVIECSAAELHAQNPNYGIFRLGQVVRCHSVPHLLDRDFPLIKMSLNLDTAAKRITLGSMNRATLTEVTKEVSTMVESYAGDMDDMEVQVTDLSSVLEAITKIPGLEDLIGDITGEVDGIRDFYSSIDFQGIIDDAISGLDLEKYPTLGDQLGEILGVDLSDPGVTQILSDLGLDPQSTTPITTEDITRYLQEELDKYTIPITQSTGYTDLSDATKDLDKLWGDRSSLYGQDDTGTYDSIGDAISGFTSKVDAITDGSENLVDINTDLIDMGKTVNDLSDFSQETTTTLQEMGDKIDSISKTLSWTFQIDGSTSETGTVNFVTTV